MPEVLEDRPFVPAGERIARLETHVCAIREDVAVVKETLAEMKIQHAQHDAYAKVGKWVWGIAERVLLALFGAAGMLYLQRHWPGR